MNAMTVAMRVSPYLPLWLLRGGAWTGAMVGWLRRGKSTRRLEENLGRVTGLGGSDLRRLSRRGMLSASRYYAEVLELPRMKHEVVDARVRLDAEDAVLAHLATEGKIVVALGHSGNWDLVGAYACRNITTVITVAEVLRPREAYEQFVALRENLGMVIFGHEGSSTFRKLIRAARTRDGLLCLLADRDLSGTGVEVEMWGHRVRVAPGPSALAVATDVALIPVTVYYERLHGQRRRQAKSRWGTVMSFGPIVRPGDVAADDRVGVLTRGWTSYIADAISAHPQDWHMLQRFGWVE